LLPGTRQRIPTKRKKKRKPTVSAVPTRQMEITKQQQQAAKAVAGQVAVETRKAKEQFQQELKREEEKAWEEQFPEFVEESKVKGKEEFERELERLGREYLERGVEVETETGETVIVPVTREEVEAWKKQELERYETEYFPQWKATKAEEEFQKQIEAWKKEQTSTFTSGVQAWRRATAEQLVGSLRTYRIQQTKGKALLEQHTARMESILTASVGEVWAPKIRRGEALLTQHTAGMETILTASVGETWAPKIRKGEALLQQHATRSMEPVIIGESIKAWRMAEARAKSLWGQHQAWSERTAKVSRQHQLNLQEQLAQGVQTYIVSPVESFVETSVKGWLKMGEDIGRWAAERKRKGEHALGMLGAVGSSAAWLAGGFVEGATFVVRPWQWPGIAKETWGLITEPSKFGSVVTGVVETVKKEPRTISYLAGNILGASTLGLVDVGVLTGVGKVAPRLVTTPIGRVATRTAFWTGASYLFSGGDVEAAKQTGLLTLFLSGGTELAEILSHETKVGWGGKSIRLKQAEPTVGPEGLEVPTWETKPLKELGGKKLRVVGSVTEKPVGVGGVTRGSLISEYVGKEVPASHATLSFDVFKGQKQVLLKGFPGEARGWRKATEMFHFYLAPGDEAVTVYGGYMGIGAEYSASKPKITFGGKPGAVVSLDTYVSPELLPKRGESISQYLTRFSMASGKVGISPETVLGLSAERQLSVPAAYERFGVKLPGTTFKVEKVLRKTFQVKQVPGGLLGKIPGLRELFAQYTEFGVVKGRFEPVKGAELFKSTVSKGGAVKTAAVSSQATISISTLPVTLPSSLMGALFAVSKTSKTAKPTSKTKRAPSTWERQLASISRKSLSEITVSTPSISQLTVPSSKKPSVSKGPSLSSLLSSSIQPSTPPDSTPSISKLILEPPSYKPPKPPSPPSSKPPSPPSFFEPPIFEPPSYVPPSAPWPSPPSYPPSPTPSISEIVLSPPSYSPPSPPSTPPSSPPKRKQPPRLPRWFEPLPVKRKGKRGRRKGLWWQKFNPIATPSEVATYILGKPKKKAKKRGKRKKAKPKKRRSRNAKRNKRRRR